MALIWYPYLRLQTTRNFVDVKSIVMRQSTGHPDYKATWCNPSLTARTSNGQDSFTESAAELTHESSSNQSSQIRLLERLKNKIRGMYGILGEGFTFNFDQPSWVPGSTLVLLLLALATFIFVALESFFTSKLPRKLNWRTWLSALSWGAIVLAIAINEFVIARLLSDDGVLSSSVVVKIRITEALLIFAGIAILLWRNQIADSLQRFSATQASPIAPRQTGADRSLFAFGIVRSVDCPADGCRTGTCESILVAVVFSVSCNSRRSFLHPKSIRLAQGDNVDCPSLRRSGGGFQSRSSFAIQGLGEQRLVWSEVKRYTGNRPYCGPGPGRRKE
jgi:hypothetical protein